jgi:hypothetical protein
MMHIIFFFTYLRKKKLLSYAVENAGFLNKKNGLEPSRDD